jgi:hypothetical protein
MTQYCLGGIITIGVGCKTILFIILEVNGQDYSILFVFLTNQGLWSNDHSRDIRIRIQKVKVIVRGDFNHLSLR